MTSSSTTDSYGTTGRLQFAAGSDRPTVPDVTVFCSRETTLLGTPATVEVIGSSHRVTAPALDFAEVASCKPIADAPTVPVDLDGGADRTVTATTPAVEADTTIRTGPISWFDRTADYDLRHDFEPGATTAISLREDGYETYHTYPELDCALYTETDLRRREEVTEA